MSVMQDSGVIDISGAISSILAQYQTILQQYQQMVTGDPAALQSASQQYAAQATQVASVSSELSSQASGLGANWEGNAYTAFNGATQTVDEGLNLLTAALRSESQRVEEAATALQQAAAGVGQVMAQFQQNAQILIAEAKDASASEVSAFFGAAQQLGDSAVTAAGNVADQLSTALAELFGLGEAGEGASGESGENGEKGEEGGEKEGPEKPDPPNKEQIEAAAGLLNSPWAQNLYKKLTGNTLGPQSLSLGPLGRLDQELAPNSGEEGEDPSLGKKLLGASDVKLFDLPGSTTTNADGSVTTTSGEVKLDGGSPKVEGKITDTFWSDSANASGTLGGAGWNVTNQVSTNVGATGSASFQNGQFQVSGDAKANLLEAQGSESISAGPVTVQNTYDATVGADANAQAAVGADGANLHAGAFVGGQVTAKQSVDVAGVGVGATESLRYGVGAQVNADASWNDGDIKLDLSAGAALGVGGSVGANIDVNLPKIGSEIEQYGSSAVTSVENSASAAAATLSRWSGW